MSVGRFRNRVLGLLLGTKRNCPADSRKVPLVDTGFSVPGTAGNRRESNGSRFFPSLDGNRDQDRIWRVVR